MDLIKELKDEHNKISTLFKAIKKFGVHTMEGRNLLCSASETFLDHLRKEDERLYPILKKTAEKDPALKDIIETFNNEMNTITNFAERFFRKYSIEGGGIDFLDDYNKLFSSFSKRIEKEEMILFNKYNELIKDQ